MCGLDQQVLSRDLDVYTDPLTLALIQIQFNVRDRKRLYIDQKAERIFFFHIELAINLRKGECIYVKFIYM